MKCIITAITKDHIPFIGSWIKNYSGLFPTEDMYIFTYKSMRDKIPPDFLNVFEYTRGKSWMQQVYNQINVLLGRYKHVLYTKPSEYLVSDIPIDDILKKNNEDITLIDVIAPVHTDHEPSNIKPLINYRQYCVRRKPHMFIAGADITLPFFPRPPLCQDGVLVDVEFIDKRYIPSAVLKSYNNKPVELLPDNIKERLSFIDLDLFEFNNG